MNRNLIHVGALALALAFSAAANAQRVMEKPRESVRESLKSNSLDTTIKSTNSGASMSFDTSALKKPVANDNSKPATNAANDNYAQCNTGPLNAGQLFNKVSGIAPDISLTQVQDLIKGGYLTRGICQKPLESLSAEALANAIRIAAEVNKCLSGQSPVNHPKSEECHAAANKTVLGLSDAEAAENAQALKKCAYNGEQASL